jgi:ABC-type sugar transport system permease subunit
LGFMAALFVNQGWPLSAMGRTIFFSPYAVAASVIGLIWVWLLDTQYGLINQYLNIIGIDNIPWITSYEWAFIGVSIASIWWDLGLAFILFLAGLQDISKDLIEAAKIDGANRLQRLVKIIIPLMRPIINMVLTLQLIATLRIFSQILVMTYGGPAGGSSSPIFYIYSTAIERQLFGYSSAVSMILFVFILILTLFMRMFLKERA